MSATETQKDFGKFRQLLWPIHNHELKKFLPLAFIMFCILFNYTLLRDTKDSLVVNSGGASVIPFLKFYCVTPAAALFVIFYAKLTNALSREKVFYAVVTPFLVFFGLFAFVIYPNLNSLHPEQATLDALNASYPALQGFINMFGYWAFSLFYVLSEIWGSAMIALMFWQFANQVVRMNEAKRFYGLFVVISNIALIISGQAVRFFSTGIKGFYVGYTDAQIWQISMYYLMTAVVIFGVLAMWTYRWMHKEVLTDPRYYDEAATKPKKKKKKPGLAESFKIIVKSPELGLIAMLIMAYGVTINLVEVQWKEQLKFYFSGDKGAYNAFMGNFSTWTGFVTIIFSLFIGSRILRLFSWFTAAVITPVVILIGGSLFFCFILSSDLSMLKGLVESVLASFKSNPLTAAVFLGAAIVVLSKAIKYSLFDPTKEMAYIPLDDELKTKGKAAVDVIGGRAGKAGGAGVQQLLFILLATGETIAIAPYSFVVFIVICFGWILSDKILGKKVDSAMARKKVEQQQEPPVQAAPGDVKPKAQPA